MTDKKLPAMQSLTRTDERILQSDIF